MTQSHAILIRISLDLIAGIPRLKKIISEFSGLGEITAVSSIYKRYLNQRSEDLNSELVLVTKLETQKTFEDVFHFLNQTEARQKMSSPSVVISLLSFDQTVRLFPGQNLPSPLLHAESLTLRCASEVWGIYEHPVLGQTLNELVRSAQPLSHVEFFAQGRSLFSPESV